MKEKPGTIPLHKEKDLSRQGEESCPRRLWVPKQQFWGKNRMLAKRAVLGKPVLYLCGLFYPYCYQVFLFEILVLPG